MPENLKITEILKEACKAGVHRVYADVFSKTAIF